MLVRCKPQNARWAGRKSQLNSTPMIFPRMLDFTSYFDAIGPSAGIVVGVRRQRLCSYALRFRLEFFAYQDVFDGFIFLLYRSAKFQCNRLEDHPSHCFYIHYLAVPCSMNLLEIQKPPRPCCADSATRPHPQYAEEKAHLVVRQCLAASTHCPA
jgi:hypothetical protein